MKTSVFHFVVGLSLYIRTATADAETVWLRDVTTRFQTDKRTLNDPDLPDHLSFHLKRKSHALTLNLKRNHHIDPNADIYIVRKLKDCQSLLEKTRDLEKEDVAYNQDRENGAFMTAKCIKRSSGQCDILINGNVRIGDRSYDLRPSEADVTSRNLLETTCLLDKRYDLQEQGTSQIEMSVEHKEETHVYENNLEKKLTDLLQRIPRGQDKQKQFLRPDVELSKRNVSGLHNKGTTGDNMSETNNKYDTIRNLKKEYFVEALVLIDSSVWDLLLTTPKTTNITKKEQKAQKNIRRWYSHIINGVDLLYKGIEDPSEEISVNIRAFVLLPTIAHFPHIRSRVEIFDGLTVINTDAYLLDLSQWDICAGFLITLQYDQAILFTRYHMYLGNFTERSAGVSFQGGVCHMGYRVQIIHSADYFRTVYTTAHELGHSLGAWHDGSMNATACKAEDKFIMTPGTPRFDPTKEYSRNPWLFSSCSVEAFKYTLKNKYCLTYKGNYSKEELDEWNKFISKLPGVVYGPNEQCHLINGEGSIYCGIIRGMICQFMYCTDPNTGRCMEKYFGAATGTACGTNKWCKEGLCVLKGSKKIQTVVCHIQPGMKLGTLQDFRVV